MGRLHRPFRVATDDGVLMGTYIHHVFLEKDPQTRHAIREAVVTAGLKRVRPAAMTTATTLIALLPVLTSTGKEPILWFRWQSRLSAAC